MAAGLRAKPTFNQLIDYIEKDPVKFKIHNRNAKVLRNSIQLSQLDGEGMRQMEMEQGNIMKHEDKERLIKQMASEGDASAGDLRRVHQNPPTIQVIPPSTTVTPTRRPTLEKSMASSSAPLPESFDMSDDQSDEQTRGHDMHRVDMQFHFTAEEEAETQRNEAEQKLYKQGEMMKEALNEEHNRRSVHHAMAAQTLQQHYLMALKDVDTKRAEVEDEKKDFERQKYSKGKHRAESSTGESPSKKEPKPAPMPTGLNAIEPPTKDTKDTKDTKPRTRHTKKTTPDTGASGSGPTDQQPDAEGETGSTGVKNHGVKIIEGRSLKWWSKQNITVLKTQAELRGRRFANTELRVPAKRKGIVKENLKPVRVGKEFFLQELLKLL